MSIEKCHPVSTLHLERRVRHVESVSASVDAVAVYADGELSASCQRHNAFADDAVQTVPVCHVAGQVILRLYHRVPRHFYPVVASQQHDGGGAAARNPAVAYESDGHIVDAADYGTVLLAEGRTVYHGILQRQPPQQGFVGGLAAGDGNVGAVLVRHLRFVHRQVIYNQRLFHVEFLPLRCGAVVLIHAFGVEELHVGLVHIFPHVAAHHRQGGHLRGDLLQRGHVLHGLRPYLAHRGGNGYRCRTKRPCHARVAQLHHRETPAPAVAHRLGNVDGHADSTAVETAVVVSVIHLDHLSGIAAVAHALHAIDATSGIRKVIAAGFYRIEVLPPLHVVEGVILPYGHIQSATCLYLGEEAGAAEQHRVGRGIHVEVVQFYAFIDEGLVNTASFLHRTGHKERDKLRVTGKCLVADALNAVGQAHLAVLVAEEAVVGDRRDAFRQSDGSQTGAGLELAPVFLGAFILRAGGADKRCHR